MSKMFIKKIYSLPIKNISITESVHIAVDILDKINEPMNKIFNDDYINKLSLLNNKIE